ncbi:benzoate 4-monooxygenase cytochrome p450 [Sporothrix brasiliensis 5110]|uniref:Benzoate 4-monooxygenase cytochrome p450 n=1 Tax=Sporothrix brasiliensis 5110 TaxID=1398154 RepID=A0A0C2J2G7_9PEZI|nr:benzoate 4-monooxygenase cytochrome p450 [Sporothrix brasiliensis 5110]KIH93230.1 benzoate 4-monooxygenase cytochrome p450 [Sporothrix brasiliensis 5110]
MPAVLLLLLGLFIVVAASSMRRLVTGALASIPGPRFAALSRVWYAYQVRNGRLLQLAKTLHKKYGPVVRVAPNEVWFDSQEAFRVIYNPSHGFDKSDFYLSTVLFHPEMDWRKPSELNFPDTLDLLSERDMKRYRQQRRLIGPVYHETNVAKFGSAVDAVLDRAVAELRSLNGAEVDLKEWMHIVAVECLGAVVLGWSPKFLQAHSDFGSSSASYYNWRRKSVFGLFPGFVVAEFLCGGRGWVIRPFAAVWRLGYETRAGFRNFFTGLGQRVAARVRKAKRAAAEAAEKAEKAEKEGKVAGQSSPTPKAANRDLMADLIDLHRTKPDFNDTYLRRMAITNFGAGHETMCSALTAAVAMIGSHPDAFQTVADEVRALKGNNKTVCSARDAMAKVPFTAASIKEAQRLHPAIGMSLSRVVPDGPPVELHGHVLPPGTIVGCSPPALHRNREVFGQDADEFRPGRWLDAQRKEELDPLQRRLMERINLTWGGGARTCPGRYLAELVVYKAVVALVRNFDIEATMPADEDIRYYFLAMLNGARARFHVREAGTRRRKDSSNTA